MQKVKDFFNRREIAHAVVALACFAIAYFAKKSGVAIPDSDLALCLLFVIGSFLASFFEGAFKPEYAGALEAFLNSSKMKMAFLGVLGVVLNDVLLPTLGLKFPPEAITLFAGLVFTGLVGKTAADTTVRVNQIAAQDFDKQLSEQAEKEF